LLNAEPSVQRDYVLPTVNAAEVTAIEMASVQTTTGMKKCNARGMLLIDYQRVSIAVHILHNCVLTH